jgi:TPR repeat protein
MRAPIRTTLLAIGLLAGSASLPAQDFEAGAEAAKAGDFATALAIWRPLAESGDPAAQFNLGMMYARGDGVPEDFAEAASWFRKAAEQGQVEAQARLGGMYARGIGVDRDYLKAAEWLNRAATRHHRQSQYELGTLYANGMGVEQDYGAAYFWFTLAGLQKYIPALVAKDELRPYMTPGQMISVEKQADEWLQKNMPAEGGESSAN